MNAENIKENINYFEEIIKAMKKAYDLAIEHEEDKNGIQSPDYNYNVGAFCALGTVLAYLECVLMYEPEKMKNIKDEYVKKIWSY